MNPLMTHASAQFRKNPSFYFQYDLFWMLSSLGVAALLLAIGWQPVAPDFGLWIVPVFPVLLYGLITAHLCIHNATHGNFPKPINRLVGELLGLIVVVRYASWEIVHMRHHRYSDDRVKDPHPNFSSFWRTVWHTVITVEKQLQQQYYDVWGDTPENHRRERIRAWISYGSNVALVGAWFVFLGPAAFVVFTVANLLAGLFVIHFNWSTHNAGFAKDASEFRPVNLNRGYYWLGNKLFFGIYMHANHHRRSNLFNPAWWPAKYGEPEPIVDALPEEHSKPLAA